MILRQKAVIQIVRHWQEVRQRPHTSSCRREACPTSIRRGPPFPNGHTACKLCASPPSTYKNKQSLPSSNRNLTEPREQSTNGGLCSLPLNPECEYQSSGENRTKRVRVLP